MEETKNPIMQAAYRRNTEGKGAPLITFDTEKEDLYLITKCLG